MRLIDADSIKYDLYFVPAGRAVSAVLLEDIDAMPTIDAVEVVRCGSCKHYGEVLGAPMCRRTFNNFPMDSDGFCSYGERKENKTIKETGPNFWEVYSND